MFLGRSEYLYVYYNSFHETFRVAQFVNKINVPITVVVLIFFFPKSSASGLSSEKTKCSPYHSNLFSLFSHTSVDILGALVHSKSCHLVHAC